MRQSAIETYEVCPAQYDFKYRQGIETIPDQSADNALYLGTAIHYGAETRDIQAAIDNYLSNYYVITDQQINEVIKLEHWLKQLIPMLPDKAIHEYSFNHRGFTGTADMLVQENEDGTYNLYDFKYSNNIERYSKKRQLHIYKYFLHKYKFRISQLFYIFIPKTKIRQKKTETIEAFRNRLKQTLNSMKITVLEIPYDHEKVMEALELSVEMLEKQAFEKTPSKLCDWCEYKEFCQKGEDYMLLPTNERRTVKVNERPHMWLYGDSYVGKTVFMDSFDDVLMINTDGNISHVSSPVIRIKDTVETTGRAVNKTMAWKNFLDVVAELEKGENTFKTILLDLVEDLYEHCRLYVYDRLGIEHETDAGYGKGWDMVKMEFQSTIKRLKNLNYQVVYASKILITEITTKGGGKITRYAPNLPEKVANVLAGTVDMTVRLYADGDERYMSFKQSPYIFGGGRYDFGTDRILLDKKVFLETMAKAKVKNASLAADKEPVKEQAEKEQEEFKQAMDEVDKEQNAAIEPEEPAEEETPKRRKRRTRAEIEAARAAEAE